MRTNRCRRAEPLMQLLVDGTISRQERADLDAHLSVCARCSDAMEELRALDAAATVWAAPSARDDPGRAFDEAVLATISRRAECEPEPAPFHVGWLLLPVGLAVCAVAALPFLPATIIPAFPDIDAVAPHGEGSSVLDMLAALPLPAWATAAGAAALAANALFIRRAVAGPERAK